MGSTQRNWTDALQILLIEDNPGDARLFKELVRESEQPGKVQREEDLASGLSAVEEHRPDVIAVDLELPDSEGVQTVERFAESVPDLPIVVLAGQQSEELVPSTLEVGATEFLRKDELTPSLLGRTLRWAAERKSMEQTLKEREKRVRSVLDALAANVAVIDRKGTIIDVNERWKQFARENDGDLDALGVGANYLDAGASAEQTARSAIPAVREEIRAVAEGEQELFEYQYPCHGPDEERWFLLRATPLEREEGGAVVAHVDVTERVKAVWKQRVLSSAVEQAQEAVLITEAEPIDEPGPEIVYVNSAVEEMTGYAADELLGQTPRILQGPDTKREVLDSLREALEAGEEWSGETVNYRKTGTPYRVHWSIAPVRGEDGEIEYWVSVQQDVTEEREREKRLAQMAQALEQVGDKVVITEREGHIRYVNEAFEEITGYHEEEVVGKTPAVLQSGEQDEAFYEELWDTILSGETFRAEFVKEKKDGTRYVEDETISPVTDEDGEITHFVSSGRDMTERKEAERELAESEERYRTLAQHFPNGAVGVYDRDLRYTLAEGEQLGEHLPSSERMEGDRMPDIFPDSTASELEPMFRAAVEEGVSGEVETTFGGRIWRVWATPLRNPDGEIFAGLSYAQDVTEHREREEYLSVTLQSIGDAVVATDRDGYVTEMNPVAERLTGWSREEAEGERLDDVLTLHSARTGEAVESPADEVLRVGETVGLANHTVLTSRDGTEYQIADSAAPIRSEEGDLLGMVLVFRDVTETYERRRRMERQNDLFAKAQDLANVGAWEYDVRSEESIWTEEVYRIHELPPDVEASPELSMEFYHEEDRPVVEAAFARAVEEGEPYNLELRLITADGDERWIHTRGEPQTEDGDVVRVRGTIQDVTDQKKYEEELERTTSLLRLTEEMTDVGGWSVDVRGEPPYQAEWTDHLYDLFGLSSREVPPTEDIFEYFHPEDRERHRETVRRAEQTGEGWDQELRLIRADGTERWVHDIGVPITEEGEVVELRGAVQDITERKEREEQLREAKKEAERMNRLKDAFLANMSHEIRTPLTSIIGFAEIIGDEVATLEPRDPELDLSTLSRYSSFIRKGGQRLMGMLEDVLNLSKLEAGEMSLSEETVDLAAEARDIVEQFEPQARDAGLALQAEVPEEAVRTHADPEGLRIALRNLVNNATKYTEEGGQVWVRVWQEDDASVVEVEDTGIGMDPERVPELFEAFMQASDGIGREYEGSGLGLTVTRKVVDQMDGSIDVTTEKGEGSCFTVRLPRAEE